MIEKILRPEEKARMSVRMRIIRPVGYDDSRWVKDRLYFTNQTANLEHPREDIFRENYV
jgi:hypothetical protein